MDEGGATLLRFSNINASQGRWTVELGKHTSPHFPYHVL